MAKLANIDLENIVSRYDLLSESVHNVEIKDGEIEPAKSGEPKAIFGFEVLDGPDAGKHNVITVSLQKQALWKVRQLRDACGVAPNNNAVFDTDEYIGRRLKIAVSHKPLTDESGKARTVVQVDDFMAYGS